MQENEPVITHVHVSAFWDSREKRMVYAVNGDVRGTLSLHRGEHYRFHVPSAAHHPMYFSTDPRGDGHKRQRPWVGRLTDAGAQPDGSRLMDVHVPMIGQWPASFYYQCNEHPNMGGEVHLLSPKNMK